MANASSTYIWNAPFLWFKKVEIEKSTLIIEGYKSKIYLCACEALMG